MYCLFNWDDVPQTRLMRLSGVTSVVDYWTDESVTPRDGILSVEMPPRSARLLKVSP